MLYGYYFPIPITPLVNRVSHFQWVGETIQTALLTLLFLADIGIALLLLISCAPLLIEDTAKNKKTKMAFNFFMTVILLFL
jgi:hypothetical protein